MRSQGLTRKEKVGGLSPARYWSLSGKLARDDRKKRDMGGLSSVMTKNPLSDEARHTGFGSQGGNRTSCRSARQSVE